jgi:hypothetical protein
MRHILGWARATIRDLENSLLPFLGATAAAAVLFVVTSSLEPTKIDSGISLSETRLIQPAYGFSNSSQFWIEAKVDKAAGPALAECSLWTRLGPAELRGGTRISFGSLAYRGVVTSPFRWVHHVEEPVAYARMVCREMASNWTTFATAALADRALPALRPKGAKEIVGNVTGVVSTTGIESQEDCSRESLEICIVPQFGGHLVRGTGRLVDVRVAGRAWSSIVLDTPNRICARLTVAQVNCEDRARIAGRLSAVEATGGRP